MKKFFKFLFIEIAIFTVMGLVTFFEITNFNLFESFFGLIKPLSSWFIGLSLAYSFSNLFQKNVFSFFLKRTKDEQKKKGDFFIGYLIAIVLTALITPYIKDAATIFFGIYFPYFHVILMQSIVILYLLFKLKGEYEISGKYFITNELIILFYTAIILTFIA